MTPLKDLPKGGGRSIDTINENFDAVESAINALGGGSSPGGGDGAIQFNHPDGKLAGSDDLTWDSTGTIFNIGGFFYVDKSNNGLSFFPDPPPAVASNPATTGNAGVYIAAQSGGNTTIASVGDGGAGANALLIGGNGGVAPDAATSSGGGDGGAVTLLGGNGGAADDAANVGNNVGGPGGDINLTAGVGGVAAHGSANVGGDGGSIVLTPGLGGVGSTANGTRGLTKISRNLFFGSNAALADASLTASQFSLWLDDTNGACKLMIKAKQADGTVRTAAIALS